MPKLCRSVNSVLRMEANSKTSSRKVESFVPLCLCLCAIFLYVIPLTSAPVNHRIRCRQLPQRFKTRESQDSYTK